MSGYPHNNQPLGYNYNYNYPPSSSSSSSPYAPLPNHHSQTSPYASAPYAPPPNKSQSSPYPYAPPPNQSSALYTSAAAPHPPPSSYSPPSLYTQPPSYDHTKPNKDQYASAPPYAGPIPASQYAQTAYPVPYGSPFAALVPSNFPPGTDPNVIATFQLADRDGSGFIDDVELQKALTTYRESFSLRTVHLLMFHFTNSNSRRIGTHSLPVYVFSRISIN